VRKLRELGRAREALERFRAHEHEFGDNVAWQTEYAVTLVYLNERDEAIERYRRCLELDPAEPQLLVESAMLLLERREEDDLDEAWRLAGRAAELAPGAPSVLICRAELLALRGDLTEAGALYQKAIGSLPPGSELRRKLEARAKTLGQ
jgi:tetratricopeptide (TPR) repeat protein